MQNKKYKIGFIQGTFDMFHIGHLNLIENAKKQCEYLIVGVNTDELVKEYKNKETIIPFEERIRIVEAIRQVDKVVKMEDRDKLKAAKEYKFNALIMGNDWQGTDFYNDIQAKLNEIGIDVVYLNYTSGVSSTILRKKILND